MVVSKRLLAGFSIVIVFAVIVGVIGITSMDSLRETSRSVYERHVLGLEYTGKAAAAFKQVRLDSRQIVITSFYDDQWGAYETEEAFAESAEEFRGWLEKGMTVSASDELTRFYERISDIFENEFMPKAETLIHESIKDIPDHTESLYINVLLESLIEVGEQLEAFIIGSMDLNSALVQQANDEINQLTRFSVTIQTILLCVAVVVAVLIAFLITKSITVPIGESADVLSKVARGDFEARVKGQYKGELALIKNSVNETAAQLAGYLSEKMQEEKKRSFDVILSIAEAGILIKDKDGLIVEWNKGAEKILGYSRDEVIGKSAKIITPEELHYAKDIIQKQQENGEHIVNTDDEHIHKDGRRVTCSASQTPLFEADGSYSGSVVIFNDVTEKRRTEQEVVRFAAIIESAEACIITLDNNFIIQGWNAGAENILGYPASEIIGKTPHYFSPEHEWEKIDDMNRRMLLGERIGRTDILQNHVNGTVLDCSVYYSPYFDAQGSFDGAVAVLHDMSERKQLEQDLQEALLAAKEASKVKSAFLANMSHEIRTPMNAVISMTELLLEEKLTPKQHSYLMDIKISGANLLGIINDILDFSKIESGKFKIDPVHFDFSLLLKNLCSTFDFMAKNKQLSFIAETSGELPQYIYGDDIRIRQILTNLLSNAVKFTPQGCVSMKTSADDDYIYFDIADTGIGITREGMARLFNSFQQLDESANRNISGTGLGLTITKSLVEMMGGTISVDSEYGAGTVFHVALPRVDGDPELQERDMNSNAVTLHAPDALVLVVDDHEANLRVASGLLELSGIKCDTARDGKEALGMVQAKQYDLVFMDHMMPVMDGVEATACIRAMGGIYAELPIVALTANAISGVREMLIEQGMSDFLSKPIDRNLLARTLMKWLPAHKVSVDNSAGAEADGSQKGASGVISSLRSIPEIDVDGALDLMGGLEPLLESTFLIVHRKLPENIARLDEFLASSDMHGYAIEVHGLKGALNNIGCRALGEDASQLEIAAKAENREYCEIHHDDFKRLILELYEKTAHLTDTAGARKAGDIALLGERLAAAREACEEYDSFGAYEALKELRGYDYSDEINALIEDAQVAAESCDYDAALELIRQIEEQSK